MKNNIYHLTLLILLSFVNIFLECNIAQGMILRGKRSGTIHNFTMDVDAGYKYFEKFRGGVQRYMTESKDIFLSLCFKLKNENDHLVSFNGQSITFRVSIKEIELDIYLQLYEFFIQLYLFLY